jgi:hypothetical protein
MKNYLMALLVAVTVAVVLCGCKTPPGSREYTPGVGWKEN